MSSGSAWFARLTLLICVAAVSTGLQRMIALMHHRESGTVIALFRMFMGLSVVWTVYSVMRVDLLEMLWVTQAHGGYRELKVRFG